MAKANSRSVAALHRAPSRHYTLLASLLASVIALSACGPKSAANDVDIEQPQVDKAQTLRIAAAANLSDVLPDIIKGYQAQKAAEKKGAVPTVDVTYASSGKLYAQIMAGAPYDMFLSANQAFPAKLVTTIPAADKADNPAAPTVPFTYARGQLALYSVTQPLDALNTHSKALTLNALLQSSPSSTWTIANPKLAPYGASAQAYLQDQQQYEPLHAQKRLIQAENIGQAFQYTHTGSVDYGFVAQSQITALNVPSEQFYTLPPATYPPILQDGIVLTPSQAAIDFSEYLQSASGQDYFARSGYLSVR